MVANCGVCYSMLDDTKNTVKCNGVCQLSFHVKCTHIKTQENFKRLGVIKAKWLCETCKEKSPTPSKSVEASDTSTPMTQAFLERMLNTFKEEICSEIRDLKKKHGEELAELRKSVDFLSNAVDDANKKMEEWKEEMKVIRREQKELQQGRIEDKQHIRELQIKLRQLEQYSRRENIEISGLPETAGEDVMELVSDVGAALGISLDRGNVVAAHRVPSFNKARPPTIVVRFLTRDQRDAWISGFRKKRNLSTKDVNPSFPSRRFYVSEHLSPDLKRILSNTKEFCKAKGFAYVWVKEGKVFLRKREGDRAIRIDDIGDLNNLK